MNTLEIIRDIKCNKQIMGQLFVLNENKDIVFQCFTLELPWKNNQQYVSAIPEGVYDVVKRYSAKYGNHLHILNVPNRDLVLIHEANFVRNLLGCIAVGEKRLDIDKDGLTDVTNSVATKNKLLSFLDTKTTLTISSFTNGNNRLSN
jgi:hypothetical protein